MLAGRSSSTTAPLVRDVARADCRIRPREPACVVTTSGFNSTALCAWDGMKGLCVLPYCITKCQRHRALAIALGGLAGIRSVRTVVGPRGGSSCAEPHALVAASLVRSELAGNSGRASCFAAECAPGRASACSIASHCAAGELAPPTRRLANVREAFRASTHPELAGARLLLVDDIMTTGTTVNEAAKTRTRAGAKVVAIVVLARAEGLG